MPVSALIVALLLTAQSGSQPRVSSDGYLAGWRIDIPKRGPLTEPACFAPYANKAKRTFHCGEPKDPPDIGGTIEGGDGRLEGWTVIVGRAVLCTDPLVQPQDRVIICDHIAGE